MNFVSMVRILLPGVILTAVLPVLPAAAQQASWRASSSSGDQSAFIDTASITRDGDRVRFLREVRGTTRSFPDGRRYDRLGSRMEIDCRAGTARNLELYANLGETTVAREAVGDDAQTIQSGSTLDADRRAVCANEWPR